MATSYKRGDKDTRPWGTWEVLEASDNYCVKKICVTPGNILSLQLHLLKLLLLKLPHFHFQIHLHFP